MTQVVDLLVDDQSNCFGDSNTVMFVLVPQQSCSGSTVYHCEYVFVWFVDVYVTTLLYDCLLEKLIFWWIFITSVQCTYKCRYTCTHIYTNKHIHLHTFLSTVSYSCHLAISSHLEISSYHKFYQQYFQILLNYKKLEKFIAIKRKKLNK